MNASKEQGDGIEPSPELEAITQRWVNALATKRGDVCRALFSDSDHLFYVGSDEDEIFEGGLLLQGYVDHVEAIPNFTTQCQELKAFTHGDTGWSVWVGTLHFPERDGTYAYRFSFVFAMQLGIWKIVHAHLSTPRANRELTGVEHTTFQQLLAAAQSDVMEKETFGVEGTATIMFTDIANSTTLAAFVGDRAWSQSIARHFESIRKIVESHEGRIVKTLGDGTMSSFVSANGALKAAAAIQAAASTADADPSFQIRVGLHAGDVMQNSNDFFGSVVNKAARIASIAEPGSVLVSDIVRAMATGTSELSFAPLPPVELKGIDGKHNVFTLGFDREG